MRERDPDTDQRAAAFPQPGRTQGRGGEEWRREGDGVSASSRFPLLAAHGATAWNTLCPQANTYLTKLLPMGHGNTIILFYHHLVLFFVRKYFNQSHELDMKNIYFLRKDILYVLLTDDVLFTDDMQ